LLAVSSVLLGFDAGMREPYDIATFAKRLAVYEAEGRPIAHEGTYHGQWSFAGRLRRPLEVVPEAEIAAWLAAHPEGRAVFVYRSEQEIPAGTRVEYTRRYRGARLALLAPG